MLAKANQKLQGTGVSIELRKATGTLSLRGILPPRLGSGKERPYQQRISLKNQLTEQPLKATPATIAYALGEARRLWNSLDQGRFDWTEWMKFEHDPALGATLLELWDKWAAHQSLSLSATTLNKDYKRFRNHLQAMPDRYPSDGILVRDAAIATLSPHTTKRMLTLLNACCNWAVDRQLIAGHTFSGLAGKIKVPRSEHEIDPFSREEVDGIIQGFATSRHYRYYLPFVKFLFLTGCRTSEAVGLRWEHVQGDRIVFAEAVVEGCRKTTKTGRMRLFPIGPSLAVLLDEQRERAENDDPIAAVFCAKQGGLIDSHNFLNRAWKSVLHVSGIRYRNQYQTRHTFISFSIEQGIPVPQIARWVGNSPETIYRHYAGNFGKYEVPSLL